MRNIYLDHHTLECFLFDTIGCSTKKKLNIEAVSCQKFTPWDE